MIIDIPKVGVFSIENVVFDFNGTLANDGKVPPRVYRQILGLAQDLEVYIITVIKRKAHYFSGGMDSE